MDSCNIYCKELDIEPIVLHEKGHFTGHVMGREFPELLEKILE
ncbi:MAG: hypothetical protein PF542_06795 [Nanoarchaeota archaeon]|jgi:hypothetical protein|nr:hypothetical protein [Nanoarchaeota archaeon]